MKPITETLLRINNEFTDVELVQVIELASHKLDLKTISNYAKEKGLSYNGVKNNRGFLKIDGVKFVVEGMKNNNLPF